MNPKRIITALISASLTVGALPAGAASADVEKYVYKGEDMCISIISDGFLTEHESFILTDTEPKLTKEKSDSLLAYTNAAKADTIPETAYVSEKIPFAYDYGDMDTDVYDKNRSDIGTAMISIAAGNSSGLEGKTPAAEGIAPEAQVFAMKVYSTHSSSVSAAATAAAIEDSVLLGADVILITEAVIGGASGISDTAAMEAALKKAEVNGIIVVCAAGDTTVLGNSGLYSEYELFGVPTTAPDVGTIAYPGVFDSVLTVGNAVSNKLESPAFTLDGGKVIPYADSNYLYTKATDGKTFGAFFDGQVLEYVLIDGVGTSEQFAAAAGDIKGKLAVVERGELSFIEKARNAASVGAVGVIVTDTQTNEVSTLESKLELTDAEIPVILVSMLGARYLKKSTSHKITITEDLTYITYTRETPSVSDTSARGTTPALRLKPDFTAIGDKVECVISDGSYALLSSTCASAAQAAGMCAVLKSKLKSEYPSLDAVSLMCQIKARLVSTAQLMNKDDGGLYSPRVQGGGVADLNAALNASLTLTSSGSHKIEVGDGNMRLMQFKLTANNISRTEKTCTLDAIVGSDSFKTYSVSELDSEAKARDIPFSEAFGYDKNGEAAFTDGFAQFTDARVMIGTTLYQLNPFRTDYDPYTFTLAPGASTTFDLTVYLDEQTYQTYCKYFTNGFFIEGFMRLTSEDETVSIPFLGYSGNFSSAPALDGDLYENEPTIYGGRYLFRYIDRESVTDEGTVILGTSYPSSIMEKIIGNKETLSFSPAVDSNNSQVFLNFALLRTVTDVNVTVTDAAGNTVSSTDHGTVARTNSRANSGVSAVVLLPIWDGRASDHPEYIYPDGEYTVTVSFRKPSSPITESFEYKLHLDTCAPSYVSHELLSTENTPLLKVEATDNFGIRSITVVDNEGNTAEQKSDGSFDMTELTGAYIYIDICDHALNSSVVRFMNPLIDLSAPEFSLQ